MKLSRLILTAVVGIGFGNPVLANCGPAQYILPWAAAMVVRSHPESITIGEPFQLVLTDCSPLTTNVVRVDAVMPEHGHGMNYKAILTKKTADQTLAENLMFHMPGLWQVSVELERAGERAIWTTDIQVYE